MEEQGHGGCTPLSASRASLLAYVRKKSREPIARPGIRDDINDASSEADDRARQWFRVGSANVGSLKRRGAEVADMLARRGVDVCALQEVRWKGGEGTARYLHGGVGKYKLYWKEILMEMEGLEWL